MRAKPLHIERWTNCDPQFDLDVFSSKIKVIHVFQMLCPGCVYRGIPQTIELYKKFNSDDLQVVGLHSVFENHEVMQPHALEVFTSEWRLPFPVGIDKREDGEWMPETMKTYQLQGTPSLIVIDHLGEIQLNSFGHVDQGKIEAFLTELINKKQAA